MIADLYEKLISRLCAAIRSKDIDEIEIIMEDIESEIAPSQVPEEDKVFLERVLELTEKLKANESKIFTFNLYDKCMIKI